MLRVCKGPVRPNHEFHHAQASIPGRHTVELQAQVRPSGRILDASRLVLGGAEVIEVEINMSDAVPSPRLQGWTVRYQAWPRDVAIRKNQATSAWIDLEAMVAGRDAEVTDHNGAGIPSNEFLGVLAELDPPVGAAFRWAVTIGDDGRLQLQLQGLPAAAPVVIAKPQLRK